MITIYNDESKIVFNGTEGELKGFTKDSANSITIEKSENENTQKANVFAIARALYKLDNSDY